MSIIEVKQQATKLSEEFEIYDDLLESYILRYESISSQVSKAATKEIKKQAMKALDMLVKNINIVTEKMDNINMQLEELVNNIA